MDIDVAATHEAGHAVLQWLVGWPAGDLQMTVNGSTATLPSTDCSYPEPHDTVSAVRKRLVVLLAGEEATRRKWPEASHNRHDFEQMQAAIRWYLKIERTGWIPGTGLKIDPPEANDLLQEAISTAGQLIGDPLVSRAIDAVAAEFSRAELDVDGKARLSASAVESICERVIGDEFRRANQWLEWLEEKVE